MTTVGKRPIWVGINLQYHQSTEATFRLIKETPEATIARVEDGCFDGAFTIEFYVDEDVDTETFARAFIEKMVATSGDGQLADDPYWGEGEIDHEDNPFADVWVMKVRPAPVA